MCEMGPKQPIKIVLLTYCIIKESEWSSVKKLSVRPSVMRHPRQ